MSPLANPPSRGYTDYQRVANYDSGVLWSASTVSGGVLTTPAPLDVSRYEGVSISFNNPTGNCQVTLTWYADQQQQTVMGQRTFMLSSFLTPTAQPRIVNLGPFLTVQVNALGGANYSLSIRVIGTNRTGPIEFTPFNPVIMSQQNITIIANSTANFYPVDYYAGPGRMVQWFGTGSNQWFLEWLDSTGNWETLESGVLTSSIYVSTNLVFPPGAWRIQMSNVSAANVVYYNIIVPSFTGAL